MAEIENECEGTKREDSLCGKGYAYIVHAMGLLIGSVHDVDDHGNSLVEGVRTDNEQSVRSAGGCGVAHRNDKCA